MALDLPLFALGQRGGPRYVRVAARRPEQCYRCGTTIPSGTEHAYDRVRTWGKTPRRYCEACWTASPLQQVQR